MKLETRTIRLGVPGRPEALMVCILSSDCGNRMDLPIGMTALMFILWRKMSNSPSLSVDKGIFLDSSAAECVIEMESCEQNDPSQK